MLSQLRSAICNNNKKFSFSRKKTVKKMKSSEGRTSSFYTLLCDDDFTTHLKIPSQFVKNHRKKKKKLPKQAKLVASDTGDVHIVRIQRIGKHHFFTNGWTRFARCARLKFCEFLLFKFVGKSTFEVSVYGINGCYKDHESLDINESESTDQTTDSGDDEETCSSFVTKLTKDHTSELEIPGELAVGIKGMIRNRRVKLEDAKGRNWPVFVSKKESGKIAITVGWNHFLTDTKIVVGTEIRIEFVSNTLIKAKVLKNGNGDFFSCVNSRRGRPPKLHH